MRRLIVIGGLVLVILIANCEWRNSEIPNSQSEIPVVDFSKKPSGNPYQELYEKMLYPTVRIKAGLATGSGVIINHQDTKTRRDYIYILSAAHVVDDQGTVTVELFYPQNIEIEASVIITDTTKDLALLRALCSATAGVKSYLAPVDYKPYIFTPVWAVGCSLGLPPRPSFWYITAIPQSAIDNPHWEISSPILPGNSGGPVYALVPSDDGNARTYEVIGIAVWVRTHNGQLITTMAGIVPIGEIYEFLKEYTDLTDLSD
ncbi:MAG: trypsin-like peptidase domain-containing protein [Planctomycetes bacterium]|nr:trypsin-like peptidase domain-containing protein [Planctomycetota bacterium]